MIYWLMLFTVRDEQYFFEYVCVCHKGSETIIILLQWFKSIIFLIIFYVIDIIIIIIITFIISILHLHKLLVIRNDRRHRALFLLILLD